MAPPALGSLVGLWITRHGLLADAPAGADIYGNVVRTDFALHEVLGQARLDGWFPDLGSGYRLFALNGPGLTLATAAMKALSFGALSTPRAFAVLGSLSIAALPWAVTFLSRTLGASRTAAAIHGLLGLCLSFFGGGGLAALYGPGLIAQSLALPIQVLALALCIRAIRHGGANLALAAATIAVLALVHPISVLILGCFIVIALNRDALRARWRTPARLGLVGMWSAALAGVWLVPAIRNRDMLGGPTGWAIPPFPTRLAEIGRGDLLFPQAIALAVVVAAIVSLFCKARWRRLAPFLLAMVVMGLSHYAVGHRLGPYRYVIHPPVRGMALAALLALLPLAEVLGDGVDWLRRHIVRAPRAVPAVSFCLIALTAPMLLSGFLLDPPQEAPPPSTALRRTAEELERTVPATGRHLLVRPPPTVNLGTNEAARWLAAESGTKSAHLYFWEATKYNAAGVLALDLLDKISPDEAHERLLRAGVSHVVVSGDEQADELASDDGYTRVWDEAEVTIFEVRAQRGEPKAEDMLRPVSRDAGSSSLRVVTVVERDPEHVSWRVEAKQAMRVVTAISYDRGWTATVDGHEQPITASAEGLMTFELPAGRHNVVLDYSAGKPDVVGLVLTLAGAGGLMLTVSRKFMSAKRARLADVMAGP